MGRCRSRAWQSYASAYQSGRRLPPPTRSPRPPSPQRPASPPLPHSALPTWPPARSRPGPGTSGEKINIGYRATTYLNSSVLFIYLLYIICVFMHTTPRPTTETTSQVVRYLLKVGVNLTPPGGSPCHRVSARSGSSVRTKPQLNVVKCTRDTMLLDRTTSRLLFNWRNEQRRFSSRRVYFLYIWPHITVHRVIRF